MTAPRRKASCQKPPAGDCSAQAEKGSAEVQPTPIGRARPEFITPDSAPLCARSLSASAFFHLPGCSFLCSNGGACD